MNCLFRACSAAIFSRTSDFGGRSARCGLLIPACKVRLECSGIATVKLELLLTRLRVRCYSARSGGGSKSRSRKLDPKPEMEEEKNAFFVVRKGDVVGVYKSLGECQAQVGSSISDPPVSVYKGFCMSKDTEEYLLSCGLKNALYSIRAADLKEDLFGPLMLCPFQQPSSSKGETPSKDMSKKRSQEVLGAENVEVDGSTSAPNDPLRKHFKEDPLVKANVLSSSRSCTLEFDGASKGNPGLAGAGAVLRADDGALICTLREGLGIATNNVAEYRALILGMKSALKKGYTDIRVLGDSKLVCMQLGGKWKAKDKKICDLFEEAKKLKDKFLSFKISHVLRDLNPDADAQANFAVRLADGEIQEELKH